MKTVLIGIQARSSSTRLPNKVHLVIDGKSILQHVIDNTMAVCTHMRFDKEKYGLNFVVCLLIPKGDPIKNLYWRKIEIREGSEFDVLSRYVEAQKAHNASYICRLTADCVFLQTHLIARHIKASVIKNTDYSTNTLVRTFREGLDVEVLSERLLAFLDKNAITPSQREHVTSYLRENEFPFYEKGRPNISHILNYFDDSDKKTSIDTEEDFIRATDMSLKLKEKKDLANERGFCFI